MNRYGFSFKQRCWTCRMFSRVGPGVRWCPRCGALNVWWCGPAQLGRVVTKRSARNVPVEPTRRFAQRHVQRRIGHAGPVGEGSHARG